MKTLILGSGFGLYGYLPAAYKISNKIFLQKKYKNFFYSRSELKNFNNKIIWYDNLKAIINTIDIVINFNYWVSIIKLINVNCPF